MNFLTKNLYDQGEERKFPQCEPSYKISYGEDDEEQDCFDSGYKSPSASVHGFSYQQNLLKLKIEPEINKDSKYYVVEMLQKCLGRTNIEIKIKNYSDIMRAETGNIREKIQEDPHVDIDTEDEDNSEKGDDFNDDNESIYSGRSAQPRQNENTKEIIVDFPKISDLIVIQSWKELKERIERFAFQNQVLLKLKQKGYALIGDDIEALKKVEAYILREHQKILSIKVYENYPIDRIQALFHSLRHIGKTLGQNLGLTYVYIMQSTQYAETCKKLAQKIPELKQKLLQKEEKGKEKTNIRVLLYKDNIRGNEKMRNDFLQFLSENCKPHKETIKEESSSKLTPYELKELRNAAFQAKFYLAHDQQTINQGNSKIKILHSIDLVSYYTNEEERKRLLKDLGKLKTKIKNIIKPSIFYEFDSPALKFKYDCFVRSEIEKLLKEKDVKISLVRDESNKNHQNNFRHPQTKLSLQIDGDKQNTKEIKGQIVSLMKKVKFEKYHPKYPDHQHAHDIKRNIEKIQNLFFLKSFFDELHASFPNVKITPRIKGEFNSGGRGGHRGDHRGSHRGGHRGSHRGGRGGSHHNNEREQNSPFLEIQILYLDQMDFNAVKLKLDEFFASLSSVLYPRSLKDLFSKTSTNLKDFQTEYDIIIEEISGQANAKTILIGTSTHVEAAVKSINAIDSKPVKEEIQIRNPLLLNAFKSEYKCLVSFGINCRPTKAGLNLFGDSVKVRETKNKIEDFLKNKEQQLQRKSLKDIPGSYLKAIEEKRKFVYELQYNNKVWINFIKPKSSKIEFKTGIKHLDSSKQLIVVKGDITKIQVDAIASSTNLLFDDANIVQGVAKAIKDKAGEDYIEECLNYGELKETQVFLSGNGNLTNCKNVINVCPPMYQSEQSLPQALIKLRLSVKNVLNACSHLETVAIPLLASGNYGFPADEAINAVTEELAQELFKTKTSLKRIYICEIDQDKINFLEQQMKSMIGEKADVFEEKYQWQFLDDYKIWKNYDLAANRLIDREFSKGKMTFDVKLPIVREIGSHTVDLANKTLTRLSTNIVTRIERKPDGWYESGEKLPIEVSEIIDLKHSQGHKKFDLFLNEYAIDFATMEQTNKATNHPRDIRKVPFVKKQYNQKFEIQNVTLIKESTQKQGSVYGQIDIEFFDLKSFEDTRDELNKFIQSQLTEVSIVISPQSGESHINYLKEEIEKHKLEFKGQLKPKQTIQLKGIKHILSKIQNYFNTISQVQVSEHVLPSKWKDMGDSDFELVSLPITDQENQFVSQRFAQTLPNKKIRTVYRIQNAKFWKDFCQEKTSLGKNRSKYGLDPKIKEEWLWHGTRGTDPSQIYAGIEECFDMQYANDGMWGRGLYFAVNASYSDGYATQKGSSRLFMLCRVLIGDCIALPSNSSLRKPPHRNDIPDLTYESIKGHTGNSDIYILYRMRRAYPEYLIEYA